MKLEDQIKGGESMTYSSSVLISLSMQSKYTPMKIRNENTNGKFVTQEEYDYLMTVKQRKEKLNRIDGIK
jgi:hypothetical protein